jgi:DNA uptake protein ComE-like DNA-binding protein
VNRATAADWLRLPGCRREQVDLLLRLQAGGVQLSGLDDLQRLLDLGEADLHAWQPLLEFRWYGTAPPAARRSEPIAINQAGPRELERLPDIGAELVARLLRERARRPFSDLADLQQRLQLSAAIVEAWIGRVAFQAAPTGPVLPPASRPNP